MCENSFTFQRFLSHFIVVKFVLSIFNDSISSAFLNDVSVKSCKNLQNVYGTQLDTFLHNFTKARL